MLKRIAPVEVFLFILSASCVAVGQKSPSADLLQGLNFDGSVSPEMQRQVMHASSLPDAPSSVVPQRRAERFPPFVNDLGSPLTVGLVGVSSVAMRGELGQTSAGPQPSWATHYPVAFIKTKPNAFLGKYFYEPMLKQDNRYYASTSASFMGRASYAASCMFVTRDHSGKTRLNTKYFFGVLTSVASAAAHRPYWARSTSGTFNNFGTTIGSDAGINVFHEFGPGIRQMVKGHAPKFVSRIAEYIIHAQTKNAAAIPAR